jgi:hypothetical protein
MSELLLDRAGRRRSPATMPGFHAGRPPRNKGVRYPADPPKVEETIAVMRAAGDDAHGVRLRGLIDILWRAGLRIQEALALAEADLDPRRGSLLVRRGRAAAAARSGWTRGPGSELQPWLAVRVALPVGPLFCIVTGPTRGRHWSTAAARADVRRTAAPAGVRRRFAPHQLRNAHAVELARESVPLIVIQRQLGHSNLGIHQRLPPRHRQRRDHRLRPRPQCPDDPGHRLTATLIAALARSLDVARRAQGRRDRALPKCRSHTWRSSSSVRAWSCLTSLLQSPLARHGGYLRVAFGTHAGHTPPLPRLRRDAATGSVTAPSDDLDTAPRRPRSRCSARGSRCSAPPSTRGGRRRSTATRSAP